MSYYISQESDVNAYPQTEFMAFFESKVTIGMWKQASGFDSCYGFVLHEHAQSCIVISQGRSESVVKYAEVIFECYQNGYSVFIFDHQGQGQSSRLMPNRDMGYVKDFNDYVSDMHTLINKVLNPLLDAQGQAKLPKLLLCHSMGGAIGVLYVQTHPKVFNKLVLSAPMMGISSPISESLTLLVVGAMVKLRAALNLPEVYFWGQGNYEAYPFDKNRLTTSEIRYRVFKEMMAHYPQNQLGGISFSWLKQAIINMRKARKNARFITIPTLIFQAEQEQIVDNKKMSLFVKQLPNATLIVVPDAQHEVLFEKDTARNQLMIKMFDFLAKR